MLIRATDYDAVNAGETDFEHYFCSFECAEQADYESEDCDEIPLEEIEPGDEYNCENCGCSII